MEKTSNLQDRFLNSARKEHAIVTVFLVNGFQIRGVISCFRQLHAAGGIRREAAIHL